MDARLQLLSRRSNASVGDAPETLLHPQRFPVIWVVTKHDSVTIPGRPFLEVTAVVHIGSTHLSESGKPWVLPPAYDLTLALERRYIDRLD
jgi:hypothetical protein